MNKIHVFAVLVLAIGLLFSCSNTDDLKLPEPGQVGSSSSGGVGLQNSSSGKALSSSSSAVPSSYCNYGDCSLWDDEGLKCLRHAQGWENQGGCYPMPTGDNCASGTVVSSCPAGATPPGADYGGTPSSSSAVSSSSSAVLSSSSIVPSSSSVALSSSSVVLSSSSVMPSSSNSRDCSKGNMCLWPTGCWQIGDDSERADCASGGWIFEGGEEGSSTCRGGEFTGCGKDNTYGCRGGEWCLNNTGDCFEMQLNDSYCCEQGIIVASEAECSTTPRKFCNWGQCQGGNGWNCSEGGCFIISTYAEEERCNGGSWVVSCCPYGTTPPNASGKYNICR